MTEYKKSFIAFKEYMYGEFGMIIDENDLTNLRTLWLCFHNGFMYNGVKK